jgi:hypothetical protein
MHFETKRHLESALSQPRPEENRDDQAISMVDPRFARDGGDEEAVFFKRDMIDRLFNYFWLFYTPDRVPVDQAPLFQPVA